ncbi:hypothetical protein HQ533_05900 [Candidatus Woesearchaeota archaeon]|nr:hypothetical protein [Candidatus Woesearchaeota archaeon]
MKKKLPALLTLFLIILSMIPFVSAQQGSEEAFGQVFEMVISVFLNLASKTVTMPIFGGEASYLALFATWLIIFSLFWVGTGKIPPFKDSGQEYKGARKIFAISLSLLVSFGSPLPVMITNFMHSWFSIAIWYASILFGILLLWAITSLGSRGFSGLSKYGAESKQTWREASDMVRGTYREGKAVKNEGSALKGLRGLIGNEKARGANLIQELEKLKQVIVVLRNTGSPEAKEELFTSLRTFSTILQDETMASVLDTKIKDVLQQLQERDGKVIKGLNRYKKEQDDLKQHLINTVGKSATEADADVQKAIEDSKKVAAIEGELNNIITTISTDMHNVTEATKVLKNAIANPNDANLANAENTIDKLIQHVKAEEAWLNKANALIEQIQALLTNELKVLTEACKLDMNISKIERKGLA